MERPERAVTIDFFNRNNYRMDRLPVREKSKIEKCLKLRGILPEKLVYAQLGHKIMWLNILYFILASMLVITWFVVVIMGETYHRIFGYTPSGVFGLF